MLEQEPLVAVPRESVRDAVCVWLERAVIGLGLCPFAGEPHGQGRVRIQVSAARTEHVLLLDLYDAIAGLLLARPEAVETSLLVVPDMLRDFGAYNQFLDQVDALLAEYDWEEVVQIASFHPDYRFQGTHPDDDSNLTNRSPYPILHILRQASVDRAVRMHPDPTGIPDRNIARMERLSDAEKRHCFPFLSGFQED
jgi:hypothetical protein